MKDRYLIKRVFSINILNESIRGMFLTRNAVKYRESYVFEDKGVLWPMGRTQNYFYGKVQEKYYGTKIFQEFYVVGIVDEQKWLLTKLKYTVRNETYYDVEFSY